MTDRKKALELAHKYIEPMFELCVPNTVCLSKALLEAEAELKEAAKLLRLALEEDILSVGDISKWLVRTRREQS